MEYRKREIKIDSKVWVSASGSLELPSSAILEWVCQEDQDLSLGFRNFEMLIRCSGGKKKQKVGYVSFIQQALNKYLLGRRKALFINKIVVTSQKDSVHEIAKYIMLFK